MNVRQGNSGDFQSLLSVMRQCRERRAELDPVYRLLPDAEERLRRWVGHLAGDPRSMMLVAEDGGRILGFLIATVEKAPPIYAQEEFALIREWWVDPAHGPEAGRLLAEEAVAQYAEHDVRQVRIFAPEPDEELQAGLQRLGFRPVAREMVLESPRAGPGGKRRSASGVQNIREPKTPM